MTPKLSISDINFSFQSSLIFQIFTEMTESQICILLWKNYNTTNISKYDFKVKILSFGVII